MTRRAVYSAVVFLKVALAANAAAAHCYARWYYPTPQTGCSGPRTGLWARGRLTPRRVAQSQPTPAAVSVVADKLEFGPPADIPDIPGPTLNDIEWWEAMAKLRPLMRVVVPGEPVGDHDGEGRDQRAQ